MHTGLILTVSGAGMSFLTFLLFAGCYRTAIRKQDKRRVGPDWLDAAGFGLLPAVAVGKVFEHYTREGRGMTLPEPLPVIPWITESGRAAPCRIELCLLFISFLLLCCWLILRKGDWPRNGDLLSIGLVIWMSIRITTESLRETTVLMVGSFRLIYFIADGLILLVLLGWTVRQAKTGLKTNQTIIDWFVVCLTMGGFWLIITKTLSTGSDIGDLAAITGCSAACLTATMEAGGASRRISR